MQIWSNWYHPFHLTPRGTASWLSSSVSSRPFSASALLSGGMRFSIGHPYSPFFVLPVTILPQLCSRCHPNVCLSLHVPELQNQVPSCHLCLAHHFQKPEDSLVPRIPVCFHSSAFTVTSTEFQKPETHRWIIVHSSLHLARKSLPVPVHLNSWRKFPTISLQLYHNRMSHDQDAMHSLWPCLINSAHTKDFQNLNLQAAFSKWIGLKLKAKNSFLNRR